MKFRELECSIFFDSVLQTVKEWKPKEKYQSEQGYKDDLLEFLRERIKPSEGEGLGGYIFGSSEHHVIKKEAGSTRIDIGIDDKIGIELKLNLKHKEQLDRLFGQVNGFLREYSHLIIVTCGHTDKGAIDDFKEKLRKLITIFEPEPTIRFVSKAV